MLAILARASCRNDIEMRLDDDVPAFHCSCCFVSKQNVLVHSISPQASHLAHLLIALFPPEMKFQALLWGSLLLSCCWPTGAAKDAPLSMKPSFMLKTFLGISQDTIAEEPQDMLVIGPGTFGNCIVYSSFLCSNPGSIQV